MAKIVQIVIGPSTWQGHETSLFALTDEGRVLERQVNGERWEATDWEEVYVPAHVSKDLRPLTQEQLATQEELDIWDAEDRKALTKSR